MKMRAAQRAALIVLALSVLVSILFLGGGKLEKRRDKMLGTFFEGVDRDGLSIYHDLEARRSAAHNLLTIAKRYLKATDAAVTALQDAVTAMDAAVSVQDYFEANYDLTLASTQLYNTLSEQELSEKDERLLSEQFTEMSSRNMTISHDGYNTKAREFNAMLAEFPTSLIAFVNGVKPLDEFR